MCGSTLITARMFTTWVVVCSMFCTTTRTAAFVVPSSLTACTTRTRSFTTVTSTAIDASTETSSSSSTSSRSSPTISNSDTIKQALLKDWKKELQHQEEQQLEHPATVEDQLHGLFSSITKSSMELLGLQGVPMVLKHSEIEQLSKEKGGKSTFPNCYTMKDLKQALEDDFLDASRGSTDNRKGWKISTVSNPRGDSFEEARMSYEDVQAAMEKGTVIFNAAGAHIPKLAGPCLAVTEATTTPNAVNLYITSAGKRTSAPPHTDKQDVVVIQSCGRKQWRVYAPPDPSLKPMADVFARGKGDDNLPLYTLEETGEMLLETTLSPGDVLFVPAGFPHTTATPVDEDPAEESNDHDHDTSSVHLTFNIDTHVWDLDYLSLRRLALRRGCVKDTALGQSREEDNRYVGRVNELLHQTRNDLLGEIPLGFLDETSPGDGTVDDVTRELKRISKDVDEGTFNAVPDEIWQETVERVRQQGIELLDIHRDMYISAMDEGSLRESEDAMTAHLDSSTTARKTLSPERMQRLSLFRVQRYYEKINKVKADLVEWSYAGSAASGGESTTTLTSDHALPENWAFTMPVKVGDQVEADLGGAFFPATVSRVAGERFDVQFFDGDSEVGLKRNMLKLLAPPNLAEETVDTSTMTPKQLKRWKKQQKKKK